MISSSNVGSPKACSATGNVKVGSGALLSIIVGASAAGTITLYDDAATGTSSPLMTTLPLTAGQVLPINLAFGSGLYAVIGGAATLTLVIA
jgi:hypothetical protein